MEPKVGWEPVRMGFKNGYWFYAGLTAFDYVTTVILTDERLPPERIQEVQERLLKRWKETNVKHS